MAYQGASQTKQAIDVWNLQMFLFRRKCRGKNQTKVVSQGHKPPLKELTPKLLLYFLAPKNFFQIGGKKDTYLKRRFGVRHL